MGAPGLWGQDLDVAAGRPGQRARMDPACLGLRLNLSHFVG